MKKSNKETTKLWVQRKMPWLLMVVSAVGFLASFVLTIEKIHLLKDPSFDPSCNINPLISCGSVMQTAQSDFLGAPNAILGIVGFTMLGTIAFSLLAGAVYKRYFWLTLQVGVLIGLIFVHWLISQSIFVIHALCPYCMVVWLVTIPLFWYVTLYNLAEGHLKLPPKYDKAVTFAQKHHVDILVGWFLVIAGLVLYEFWYYWNTLV